MSPSSVLQAFSYMGLRNGVAHCRSFHDHKRLEEILAQPLKAWHKSHKG